MAEIGSKGKLKRYYSSRQRKKSPAHRRNYIWMAKLSTEANYVARLLIIYVIGDFALTPLGGLETRPVSNVTTLGLATLGLLFIGLALNIASLILILRHYKRSPIFGIVGSVLYFPAIADQTGLFSSLSPPTGITYVEVAEGIVAIGTIILGARILRNKTVSGA